MEAKKNSQENFNNNNKQADSKGASLVEYALLVALIAVVCLVAIRVLGRNASTKYYTIASAVRT